MVTSDATLVSTIPAMQNVKNLKVAEHSRRLALFVYKLSESFPTQERFGLTAQMRRAAVCPSAPTSRRDAGVEATASS